MSKNSTRRSALQIVLPAKGALVLEEVLPVL
jgi:hypothetical protein